MMVPSKSLIAGFALAAMASTGTAQSQVDMVPVGTPGQATIKMSTGEMIRGASQKVVSLALAFSNTDTSGFYGVGATINATTGTLQEWLDEGRVTTDTGSSIVGSFSFGYGTSVLDTTGGGPGASALLNFYDGIAGFCADSGNIATASFSFTGLPASTAPGVGSGWLITVDLTGGFEFCHAGAGNTFGFGFTTADDDGLGTRATGPLLCYAGDLTNCDPTNQADSNGQFDVFDEWAPNPASNFCAGTFFFGGKPFNLSSWYLTISSADTTTGTTASASNRNGTGANPNVYAVSVPPVIGSTFEGTTSSTAGGLGAFIVGYLTPLTFPTSFGELLVNITDPGGELLAGFNGPFLFAGGVASIAIPVPKDLTLDGLILATQTLEFGGGISLQNANDLVVGIQ